jgi:hypothetical protein
MKKHNTSPDVSDLIKLVNAMIAYWKSVAESSFRLMKPDSYPSEFQNRFAVGHNRLCTFLFPDHYLIRSGPWPDFRAKPFGMALFR